jgi:hypothetical protein
MPKPLSDPYAEDESDNVDGLMSKFDSARGEHAEVSHETADEAEADEPADSFADADDPDELNVEAPSRREKRKDRGGLHDALIGSRDENDRLRKRLDALEGQAAQFQSQMQEEEEVDEFEGEVDDLEKAQRGLLSQYDAAFKSGSLSPDQLEGLRTQARGNDRKLRRLHFQQDAKEFGYGPSQSPEEAQVAALRAQVTVRAPDIYRDPNAQKLLMAKYNIALSRGEADGMDLHDRVCAEVRDEMGMSVRGRRAPPTEHQKDAYSGRSRGGGGSKGKSATTIRMTPERIAMADIAFSYIKDEKKRHQAWARDVGSVLVKNGQA